MLKCQTIISQPLGGDSQRVGMPPWFICTEAGLVMRGMTPDWVLDFRDSSDDENKPLMLSNQVHINVDDVLPLCAKVSAPHQNTLTSEKWSLRTNMQQFHHEVHVHQNKPAHSRSSAAAAVKQLLLLKRQHPPFLNFFPSPPPSAPLASYSRRFNPALSRSWRTHRENSGAAGM